MDLLYFLQQRTRIIRHFYDTAAAPMIETKRRIEAGETPYDNPPYDESGEPPYLEEWLRADVEIELVGRACVSMLSEAVKQYFINWEREELPGEQPCQTNFDKTFRKDGFIAGYVACFSAAFSLDWSTCPADIEIIEQVVLARNLSQHGDLVLVDVCHDDKTRSKYPRPFFTRPGEPGFDENIPTSFMSPSLHINQRTLFEAIDHAERLAQWLQEQIQARWHRSDSPAAGE